MQAATNNNEQSGDKHPVSQWKTPAHSSLQDLLEWGQVIEPFLFHV